MLRRSSVLLIFAFAAVFGQAPNPAVARAREVLDWILASKFQEAFNAFTPEMQKAVTLEILTNNVGPTLKRMGAVESIGAPAVQNMLDNSVVTIPVKFTTSAINAQLAINKDGHVSGLNFRPTQSASWVRPSYSKPDSFSERDLSIGTDDETKLPGTLTLPKAGGKVAAVVLVHGSGPNDRDETVASHKVFKDLAEGLASRGIAVYRYDKRTRVYAARAAQDKNFTVKEETVDDAVLAVAAVRAVPEVDPKRVFVLGHSLGGYLLPQILERTPEAAGGVSMSGSNRPLEDMILEQTQYLVSLQPSPAADKRLEETRKAVAAIKALKPGDEAGPALLGIPVHYLMDLRSYDAPARAAKLKQPLLFLQGERDYQVTMVDLNRWTKALESRKDVSFKTYPGLNHLMSPGEGKANPAEYQKPGNVDGAVVADIASWITAH